MRKLFLLALLLTSLSVFGQPVPDAYRTPPSPATGGSRNNKAQWDANLYVPLSLRIPRSTHYTLNGAKDSVGYIMLATDVNKVGIYRGSGVWDTLATESKLYFDNTIFRGAGTSVSPISLYVAGAHQNGILDSTHYIAFTSNVLHLTAGSPETITQQPIFTNGIIASSGSVSTFDQVGISYLSATTGYINNQLHITGAGGISFDSSPSNGMVIGNSSSWQGILFNNANGSSRAKFYYDNTDYNFYLSSTDAPYSASRILTTQDLVAGLPSQTGNAGKYLTTNGTIASWAIIAGSGTVTSVSGVAANGFTWSIANSTTTPAITLTLQNATTSQAGQLTATDWNTFNGKQATLVSGTNIKTVGGFSILGSGNITTLNLANSNLTLSGTRTFDIGSTYSLTFSSPNGSLYMSDGGGTNPTYKLSTINSGSGAQTNVGTHNGQADFLTTVGFNQAGIQTDLAGGLNVSDDIQSIGLIYNKHMNYAGLQQIPDVQMVDSLITAAGSGAGITALTGDVTASGSGSVAATLATVNSNVGTYGDATHVPAITVNAKGLTTAVASTAITFPVSSVFGRTGVVVAATNDYTFAQIGSKPSTLSGYGITDAYPLSGNPSNFLTANQSITFTPTGDVTGSASGATSLTPALTIGAGKVTNAMLAGSIDLTSKVTGVLPIANGGTNLSSYTTGDLPYASATNVLSKLAIGATGSPIIVIGGVPAYSNLVLTNPASAATFTLAAGKTFTNNNTLTINSTDGITMTTPTTSFTTARTDAAQTFTGTQTFGTISATTISGTNLTTGGNNNMAFPSSGGLSGVSTASFLFAGASTIQYRAGVVGSAATLSSGTSYSAFIIPSIGLTTFSSGTHALLANVVINPLAVTGGGATTTNTASFFINGASTATVSGLNFSLWATGLERHDGLFNFNGTSGAANQVPVVNTGATAMTWGSVPLTQGSANLTAQTAAGNITTFTVGSSTATFNISGYINITAVTADVIELQVTYTDENNTAQTANFFTQGATSALLSAIGNSAYPGMTIRAKNGTLITLKTVLTTGTGSITFDAGGYISQI